MLIDTHAHVNFDTYKTRLDEVFDNAKDNGVEIMILPGVEVSKWNEIIEFVENMIIFMAQSGYILLKSKILTKMQY